MNITDPILDLALTHPGAVAMIRPDGAEITYRELAHHIDRVARRCLAEGLEPGQIVGLSIAGPEEDLALIIALGLARAGIVSAAMSLPLHHLAATFTQRDGDPPPNIRNIVFDRFWLKDNLAVDAATDTDRAMIPTEGIFRIFSTSGTTGTPRHCAISHDGMIGRVIGKAYPIISPDWPPIVICAIGMGGTTGTRAWLATLHHGGTLVFTNPRGVMEAVLRYGVTAMALSPATLQTIVSRIPPGLGPLPSLRALKVGGSQLPAKLARVAAERLCANIVTSMGATEVGGICRGHIDELASVPLGVGRIIPGVKVQTVDDDHNPLPAGANGLLRFRSPDMVRGYFDDEEATREVFRDGWFYSGDLGAVTAEGVLIVTGRTGDFINSGGVKVDPRIIEAVLMTLPEVTQAVAFGAADSDGLARIWAAIVCDVPVANAVLDRLCAQKLGATAPVCVLQMKELPRNANGKVMVRELAAFAASQWPGLGTPRA